MGKGARRRLAAALVALVVADGAVVGGRQGETSSPTVYTGRAFVFVADLAAARAAGWIAGDASDDAVLDGIQAALADRLRGSGRFVEADVRREEGARFAAVFVGDQAEAIEALLIGGLCDPGRLELRVLAAASDLERADTTLAAERARLSSWREAHPEAPLSAFDRVGREAGGPHGALVWREEIGADEPVALLRESRPVARGELDPGLSVVRDGEHPHGLVFTLAPGPLAETERWLARHPGRALAVTLNDAVVATREIALPLDPTLPMGDGYTLERVRELLLCAGIPLDAPLHFVERTKRELKGVKRR